MFEKLLVANRGEIAVRVIRACKELNIRTVAVYSEADSNSMHAQMADEAICIGGAPSAESYLRIDRIIGAAEISDVDAIHPGYGFLSENAHFAEVCENCNIRFIGPKSDAMNALEDKALSRELARKAGVPIPPGSKDVVDTEQEALKTAKEIGYPVMIKAVAGGGGELAQLRAEKVRLLQSVADADVELDSVARQLHSTERLEMARRGYEGLQQQHSWLEAQFATTTQQLAAEKSDARGTDARLAVCHDAQSETRAEVADVLQRTAALQVSLDATLTRRNDAVAALEEQRARLSSLAKANGEAAAEAASSSPDAAPAEEASTAAASAESAEATPAADADTPAAGASSDATAAAAGAEGQEAAAAAQR